MEFCDWQCLIRIATKWRPSYSWDKLSQIWGATFTDILNRHSINESILIHYSLIHTDNYVFAISFCGNWCYSFLILVYICDFHSSWSIWVECQHGYGWLASYVFAMVMGCLVFVEIYAWLTGFRFHTWLNDYKLDGIDDLLTTVFCDWGVENQRDGLIWLWINASMMNVKIRKKMAVLPIW